MDERNIDQVIEAYGTLVLRIARSRMATADDAEEVFQEVFITYARKQPVFISILNFPFFSVLSFQTTTLMKLCSKLFCFPPV